MHRVQAAGGSCCESKQPLIGSRYALLLRAESEPTGEPNTTARRNRSLATAAVLAPSRYSMSGLLGGSIGSVTARSRNCDATSLLFRCDRTSHANLGWRRNKTSANSVASWAVKRSAPSSLYCMLESFFESSAIRFICVRNLLFEFYSSRNAFRSREKSDLVTWRDVTWWRREVARVFDECETCKKHDLSQTDDTAIPHRRTNRGRTA